MKQIFIVLVFAIASFAFDIDVVDCKTIMKHDPPPADKILSTTYQDIKRNPSEFVCAYDACDFHHNDGWFAIKKDRTVVFTWDKRKNTTMSLLGETKDGVYMVVRVSFDKYGIRQVEGWDGITAIDVQDTIISILLTPVSECTENDADAGEDDYIPNGGWYSDKTDCPPSWQDNNGHCKKGW